MNLRIACDLNNVTMTESPLLYSFLIDSTKKNHELGSNL